MSRFAYTAVLDSGRHVAGKLRGRDRADVLRQLLARGYHPLEIVCSEERRSGVDGLWRKLFQRVKTRDLSVFTRQLSVLLRAGLPMIQALRTLRRQSRNKALANVAEDVEETLSRDGGTLAEALSEHPGVFDSVYRGLTRAGEESGNLAEVLGNLSEHLAKAARLRGQVLGAFIYPAFIAFFGMVAVFVLMTFVIPRFKVLFQTFQQDLPWPTRMLIGSSEFMASWWWAVLLAAVALSLLLVWALQKPSVRLRVDGLRLRAPILGPMFVKLEICRIARTLGTLLGSGVRILEALMVTGQTARNIRIQKTFPEMVDGVSSGQALATVVEKARIYPPLVVNLIRTGEDTGSLPEMLLELSEIYEDEAERAVTGAAKLLEPILIVLVGGIVAGIVAAVMLPIFRANTMVS